MLTATRNLLFIKGSVTPVETSKLIHIDSLRGLAILMVIFVHTAVASPSLPNLLLSISAFGQSGVQLFFVLSAFTLCLSMNAKKEPLRNFYLRRFFRIAPLYYLGIMLYMTPFVSNWAREASVPVSAFITNFLFVHSFHQEGFNYVVPGGWSIGTEMAFYAVFPFLFIAVKRLGKKALLVPLIAASFVFAILGSIEKNGFAYCSLINQLPVFLTGMVYYQFKDQMPGKSVSLVAATVLLPVAVAAFFYLPYSLTPFFCAVFFVFLIEVFRHYPINPVFLQKVGKVSFSMYLFHFVFAWDVLPLFIQTIPLPTYLLLPVAFLFVSTASFLLSTYTEKWIEQPGISLGRRFLKRPRVSFDKS